jgi:chromosomal replication initiator protein
MQQIFEFPVTPSYTFDSFVACDGNDAAVQFARRVINPLDSDNLLYVHGPSGSGKTHLLKAIGHVLAHENSIVPYFSCSETMTVELLCAACAGGPALVVDDLHLLPDFAALRAALWQLFNDYYSAGLPVVLAGKYPPRELPYLDDHLVSRLLWGLVARIDTSDDNSRSMILKKIADDRQVRVPDDVVDYILVTTSREVGELIRMFEAIYRLSLMEKRKITLPLAREARNRTLRGAL